MRAIAAQQQRRALGTQPTFTTVRLLNKLKSHAWPRNDFKTKARVVTALGLLVSAKLVTIAVPFVFKDLVDKLNEDDQQQLSPNRKTATMVGWTAISMVLLLGFARASSSVLGELRDVVFSKVSLECVTKVALQSFQHLHALDLRWHLSRQTGGLTRVIDRGSKSIDAFLKMVVFRMVPTGIELTLVTGVLAQSLGPQFAALSVSTLFLYSAFTIWVTNWRSQFRVDMNKIDAKASTRVVDSLLNFETVKLFGNQQYEANRYLECLDAYRAAALKSQSSLSMLNIGQNLIFTAGLTSMMYLVVEGISQGTMTVGDLVLVNGLLAQLAIPLNFVGTIFRETRQATIDMEEMFKLLEQPSKIQSGSELAIVDETKPAIAFQQVTFGYEANEGNVLNNLSFSILPGQTVGFVGPSGCGKSTLLRLICHFVDADRGAVQVFGKDVKHLHNNSLASVLSVVPQDIVLFNDTLYHNVAYGRLGCDQQAVLDAIHAAKLDPLVSRLPQGVNTIVGERGLKLSGGERQRIAIARAMLKDAPVLLCDEATSSLDGRTENEIMTTLKVVGKGRTTIIVAHRLATVQDCDVIFVLDKGVVVEQGSHAQLMSLVHGLYRKMWETQKEATTRDKA
ncbi:hypothetical protein BASA81_003267 [Batrachochytrium salamandrivorans]|nr:hypothetical protein BASA81_003267 [Batrachochytrium salamandrivorans]